MIAFYIDYYIIFDWDLIISFLWEIEKVTLKVNGFWVFRWEAMMVPELASCCIFLACIFADHWGQIFFIPLDMVSIFLQLTLSLGGFTHHQSWAFFYFYQSSYGKSTSSCSHYWVDLFCIDCTSPIFICVISSSIYSLLFSIRWKKSPFYTSWLYRKI